MFLGDLGSHSERAFDFRIVRREQDSAVSLNGEHAISRFQMQAVGHVFREGRAHRATSLAQGHFFGHGFRVAYSCYMNKHSTCGGFVGRLAYKHVRWIGTA